MVKLYVNGFEFSGWKRARITRGMESVAGSFELEVSDRWNGQNKKWEIKEEDECSITLDGTTVLTGYVDKRRVSYAAGDHSLQVSGRDKTGQLVDCSIVLRHWEFKDLPVLDLVQKVCDPFGITVTTDVDSKNVSLSSGKKGGSVSGAGKGGKLGGLGIPKPPKKFSIDPGDSAFAVLDRACRIAGVLPISDGDGGLLLTRAGTSRAHDSLIEGQNILAASGEFDSGQRYHTYIVSGSRQASDEDSGTPAASVKAVGTDETVIRKARTLLIRPEGNITLESAKMRAAWEMKVRAARGDSVTVTVQGWTQSNGDLWSINSVVPVRSDSIGVNGDLLITQTEFTLDESGTVTRLSLKRPDAFVPEVLITLAGSPRWKELDNVK